MSRKDIATVAVDVQFDTVLVFFLTKNVLADEADVPVDAASAHVRYGRARLRARSRRPRARSMCMPTRQCDIPGQSGWEGSFGGEWRRGGGRADGKPVPSSTTA
jgi:hypothetical protein